MKAKSFVSGAVLVLALAASAQAQTPSIAGAWGDMKLSLQECLARGQTVFQRMKFTRIEAIANTAYADFGNSQFGIRCINDRNLFFIFGGGPGDQEKQLLQTVNELKAAFEKQ